MPRYKVILFPIVLLIFASVVGTYFYDKNLQNLQDDFQQIFRQAAEKEFSSYQGSIKENILVVRMIVGFFNASENVGREEFNLLVTEIIKDHPDIEAINWIVPISKNERKEYEQKMRNKGFADFRIYTSLDSPPEKDRYFPRHYSVDFAGKIKIDGFDISTNRAVMLTIEKSMRSRDLTMSPAYTLDDKLQVITFLYPVYADKSLQGFVEMVSRANVITSVIVDQNESVLMQVSDITGEISRPAVGGEFSVLKTIPHFHVEKIWQIAGRKWQFNFLPKEYFLRSYEAKKTNLIWFSLAPILTLLIVFLVFHMIRQKNVAEKNTVLLKESEQQLLNLREALDEHAVVSVSDEEGTIIDINKKFEKISQYSRAELIGQNHRILNSGYHPESFFNHMWSTISEGKVWQGQIKNKTKDGSMYWTESTIVPFLDQQGIPEKYYAIRTEISKIKQLEESYKDINDLLLEAQARTNQEKERFETLFEKSNDGLVLIENNIFVACNEEAVRLMGYESKAGILRHPAELSPEYQSDGELSFVKAERMIELCIKNGSNHFEWVHQKKMVLIFGFMFP